MAQSMAECLPGPCRAGFDPQHLNQKQKHVSKIGPKPPYSILFLLKDHGFHFGPHSADYLTFPDLSYFILLEVWE